ncbi:autotransporter domain-containing protein [Methylobacterium sp. WL69]|uniref:autotransporter outer membrane beta-barrel domain-containing protein n=1 Tax=Methylobacterium sp. WL69 TaxID=2603893 RepID=UPI0011D76E4B|nr:autotransporter domain-containing protein [Methylobacterium sp. WL69]TXM72601.1 autotransporter domain-containing protein [Methylobacterium sp. WL69]
MASVPVWSMLIVEASAACQPAAPASGQTVTCTDAQPTGFIAPAAATGLTVNIQPGATVGSQQTATGTNPSFTNVRVNGTSVVNNAGTISNTAPLNRDNFGVNLAGDRSTLNNTGTILLTAPAGNTTTRVYGAYSSAPAGSQYENTTVTNGGVIAVTQNGNGIARGIYSGENTTLFTLNNTGLISATRGISATATTAVVAGVDSDDDTDRLVVNNAAGGRITATGLNTRAVSGRAAQYEINNSGTLTNTTANEAAIATFAVNAGNAGDATTVRAYNTVITNTATGVINGDVRNFDQDLQTAATVVNLRRTGTLTNAGTINGNVAFGGGNQTVNNTGRITGGLSFLDVAATVNTVNLGTGSSIGGNITAQGLGTNTLNLSGTGTLTGTVAGFTSLTQTGTGSAWTTAGGSVQNLSGNLTVAGGNLTLGAGSTQNVAGLIQVTGAGAQLTVNNTLTNKTVNLSGSNTSLVNNGTLVGTGAAGRANTAATRVYGVLTNSTGADFANVAVTNNGTIAVTENGIGISRGIYAGENIASMAITNAGTISATRTGTGTAAVAAIDSDDDVAALSVTNRAGATISGTGTGVRAIQGRAQAFTIANAGAITGPAGGQAIVVYGAGNGFLTNAATGVITGDVRFTDADPQVATTANRRNSTTTNAGRIAGSIQYGMGNHTLTNNGTITGNITYVDVAASRNVVNLGTGSTIGGNISAQGLGINALNLSGTGTLTSNVAGFTTLRQADGAWTLASGSTQNFSGGATVAGGVLTVNATLNANTGVGSAGTLAGTGRIGGTLTNAGIVAPGSAAAPYGTLTVTNFVQQAGGTLQSALGADGQASRLVATGTATLAGTASVTAAAGTYLPNARYTVLTAAGGVRGNFASVTDNGALPFLIRAIASTDANNAYVTLAQQSFGLVAQTANQANVARGLDAALANNPQALLVIDNQSNAGIAATLDRVSGQGYASLADPQLRSGRAFGSQLLSRAYAATTEAGPTGFTLPPTVYAADMPNRAPVPAPRFVETSRGYGLWATGYGQFGSVDSTANAAGRSETVAGMAGGIDFHPQVGTVLGIAAGYGSVDVSLNRTGERAHTDNAQVGVYGGFSSGALYANATVGYAHTEGRVNRSLGLAQIQAGGAQGKVSGDQFISAGELGYRFAVAPTTVLSPFVGFQVNTFDQDRVQEGSVGPLSLTIAAKDFLSARTLVGGRLETATTVLDGRPVSFWVKAAYVHDFADVSRTIGASFTLVPTVPFAVSSRRLARDRALVGLGVSTELAPGLAGFLGYDAELASSDTIQAVRGGVRYTF